MDQYMKMVAIPYLQKTIGDVVAKILECKQSCEVWWSLVITIFPFIVTILWKMRPSYYSCEYMKDQILELVWMIWKHLLECYELATWPAVSWLDSSVGRALHQYRRVRIPFKPEFFSGFYHCLIRVRVTAMISHVFIHSPKKILSSSTESCLGSSHVLITFPVISTEKINFKPPC